jgi:hypothetical protein
MIGEDSFVEAFSRDILRSFCSLLVRHEEQREVEGRSRRSPCFDTSTNHQAQIGERKRLV